MNDREIRIDELHQRVAAGEELIRRQVEILRAALGVLRRLHAELDELRAPKVHPRAAVMQ